MPSLPTSVNKVLEVCNNPQASPWDLNYIISLDPVLTGRVLKLINSAYYSLSQQVTTLVRAIIMLGLNTVKNLTLSTAVLASIRKKGSTGGLDMEAFWRHSLGVGVMSKLLAKTRGVDTKRLEEYFTAGLLHDIGKIPLSTVIAESYTTMVQAAKKKGLPLYKAEDQFLGITHCACGEQIVSEWKLQGAIGDVITNHHSCAQYSGPHQDLLYNVALANYSVQYYSIQQWNMGFAGDSHPELEPDTWDILKVKPGITQNLMNMVAEEIEKAQIFLKL
ncbi:MAG: HDOD domain-containing protein [Treponema sp.]|nr:HDOD domain-containing protein [Treponema sp.]